jgi:hypothetical protein
MGFGDDYARCKLHKLSLLFRLECPEIMALALQMYVEGEDQVTQEYNFEALKHIARARLHA